MPRVSALIIALSLASAPACGIGGPPAPTNAVVSGIRTINASELKKEQGEGKVAVLVDVRTPEEYASGHVPGARNIPIDRLDAQLGDLAPYQAGEVHLICAKGSRSLAASQMLEAKGYQPVDVAGGTEGWKRAGYAVE